MGCFDVVVMGIFLQHCYDGSSLVAYIKCRAFDPMKHLSVPKVSRQDGRLHALGLSSRDETFTLLVKWLLLF